MGNLLTALYNSGKGMITLTQKSQLAASITEQVKMAAIATAKTILDADKVNAMFYGSEAAYNLLTQQAQRIVRLSADNNRGIINALAEIIAASATTESMTDAQIEAAMQGAIEKLAGVKAADKEVVITTDKDWKPNVWVVEKQKLNYNSKLYITIKAHRTQVGWEPDKADSLFSPMPSDAGAGGICDGVALWDANQHWSTYSIGDRRVDEGKLYECNNPAFSYLKPSTDTQAYGWTYIGDCGA
jgi:hypothetical protein